MKLISTTDAAIEKGISKQALIKAFDRGDIDGQKMSPRTLVIFNNKKFERWEPNPNMVEGQKKRFRKKKRKARKK